QSVGRICDQDCRIGSEDRRTSSPVSPRPRCSIDGVSFHLHISLHPDRRPADGPRSMHKSSMIWRCLIVASFFVGLFPRLPSRRSLHGQPTRPSRLLTAKAICRKSPARRFTNLPPVFPDSVVLR